MRNKTWKDVLVFQSNLAQAATGLLLVACIALAGCNQPINQVAAGPAADQDKGNELEPDSIPDELAKYGTYSYGMLPSDIPDDFRTVLDEIREETKGVETDFARVVAEQREANAWLDEALDDPIDAPILTKDGKLPGPTTRELNEAMRPLFDAFAADYEKNSKDSDEEKESAVANFKAVIIDAYQGDEPNLKSLTAITKRFEAGDVDPITILPLIEYDSLGDHFRHRCIQKIGAAFDHRPCSSVTKLLLVCATAEKSNYLSFADRIRCTTAAIESVPDVLKDFNSVGPLLDYVIHNAGDALNPVGNIDYVKTVLALDKKLVPNHRRHFLIAKIHDKIGARARGAGFMDTVSAENMRIFSKSSHEESQHLLKAWTLNPTHPAYTKSLLANQLSSSSTSLTTQQWYRLALATQSDSRASTKLMAQSLQPRWGGSLQHLAAYTKKMIELAKDPGTRLLFDIPLEMYLWDESWCMNLARETDIDESILSLLDTIEETAGNMADIRFTRQYAKLIVRILWDASELDRLNEFVDRYTSVIDGDNWYSYLIPAHLVTQVMMARKELPNEAWDVLQRELMVGTETFDKDRLKRIDKAMETVRELVKKQKADETKEPESDASADDAPDEENVNKTEQVEQTWAEMALQRFERLDETIRKFHEGKTVDLIGKEMGCWSTASNGVEFNDDSIEITTNCSSKSLFFFQPLRFELPLVMELDVTQQQCDADPYGIALFAGPLGENSTASRYSGRSLRYSPGYPMIMQDRLPSERLKGPYYHEQRLIPVPMWATLRIEVRRDGTRSFVNGELITETDEPVDTGGYIHVGRRAGDTFTGVPNKTAKYKITSLRVKKLGADEVYEPIKQVAVETCRTWIPENLDLGDRKLDDFHVTVYEYVYDSGLAVLFVQFAHRRNKADIIQDGRIKIVKGGFPDYFSINVSTDGKRVISHYAQKE